MAKTLLSVQKPGLTGAAPTYGSVDATNGNTFPNNGQTLAIVRNGSASAITVTFTSVPDPYGRTGDAVVSVPAGTDMVVGPFNQALFNQTSVNPGNVNVSFSAGTTVTMALLSP